MPNEIRGVTGAKWAGELEALRSTSRGWIYFGDHPLETHSSTQQIVALSTAESEYISITKGAAHALEVRSAVMEYGLTLKVVCETDASVGRATASRRGVGRVRLLDARLLWLQQLCAEGVVEMRARPWRAQRGRPGIKGGRFEANDLASERNTPSATGGLELMGGGDDGPRACRGSKRLPCIDLEREERARDEWLVLDLYGNGQREPDGVVGLDYLRIPFQSTGVGRR